MNDAPRPTTQRPQLNPLAVHADLGPLTPMGLAAVAHRAWRALREGRAMPAAATPGRTVPESGNPLEEYRAVGEFMRLYATLRFYQLALLLGTTGSIVSALSSHAVRQSLARAEILKAGGLLVTLALLVMELRASSHWVGLRRRGNELAAVLRFEGFPNTNRWSPLSTSGASFYLHLIVAALWLTSLFIPFQPPL